MDDATAKATHTMNCPVCQAPITATASDDEDAVQKIMMAGKKHFEEAEHPADKAMSPEDMEKLTKESMKKVE